MCDNDPDTPFCSPQDGAQLQVGDIAEITWNPNFFTTSNPGPPPQQIFIQADFALTANGPPETAGFTSSPLDPNTGTFPWTILATYLPPDSTTTTATLSLAAPLSHAPTTNGTFVRIGAATIRFPGPRVHILRSTTTSNNNTTTTPSAITDTNAPLTTTTTTTTPTPQPAPSQAPNPLAIALPVTLGLLTALAMVLYAVLKRHRPDLLARGRRRPGCLSCWGVCRRRREEGGGRRVRLKGRAVEIRVVKTDLEGLRGNAVRMMGGSANGGGGGGTNGGDGVGEGNVFREEVRRQELVRGRV
ncbi:uncharacterized protein B0H64DRAFT_463401 [Chaetomium fimeti]|uniref:Uncharacterized protein n=1 Tax=Chaetomium fimeti TaxID=1854472 RepID=A0AAE0LRR4_9PEZI|nr:hypothetical protein B0H64DRAFT_463401 [Chaetomium fimeti]